MDHHSQSYQPLSHALQLPNNTSYTAPNMSHKDSNNDSPVEEEEEEGDDEGMVAQQLREQHQPAHEQERHESRSPSPKASQAPDSTPSASRRRGRPKGSRNRGGARAGTAAPQTGSGSMPPQLPEVTPHNQMYYEFQWRVLNLCSEFYGAAEELIKATQPLVIAQCYKMTTSPVDPMIMVTEAKRVCDTLLETPSKLISNPPPPMYSMPPTYYAPQPYMAPPPVASTSGKPGQPGIINQPQSFALPIAPGVYAPSQYPPSYHYQYPGYPASAYYAMQSQQQQHQPPQQSQASPVPSGSSEAHIVSSTVAGVGSNQGTWSDEETDRLKKLAQDSKDAGLNGDPAWDWIVAQWGKTRTRHQILIRLTSLGLKESSTRPSKRKRETEESGSPRQAPGGAETTPPENGTPSESPTLHPRPTTSAPGSTSWPMPAVSSNTSPIISTANSQNTNYMNNYRPRPSDSPAPKPPSSSYYNHHVNGSSGSK